MKPGRELDALVAEKVMGWRAMHSSIAEPLMPPTVDGAIPIQYKKYLKGDFFELPFYSADIAAAWDVVEKLQTEFKSVEVICSPSKYGYQCLVEAWPDPRMHGRHMADAFAGGDVIVEPNGSGYRCFVQGMAGVEIANEDGESAPHAICLAALKAFGDD